MNFGRFFGRPLWATFFGPPKIFWTAVSGRLFFWSPLFWATLVGNPEKKIARSFGRLLEIKPDSLPPPLNCHLPDPPREDLVQFFSTSVSRNRFANTLVKTVHNKTESTQMRLLLELLSTLWSVASLFRENIQNSTPDERRPQFNCVSFKPSHSKSPN